MSQPLISRPYTPPSSADSPVHSHQTSYSRGSNGINPVVNNKSTSNPSSFEGTSFRAPSRLVSSSSTSSLSAPTLAKPHVIAQTIGSPIKAASSTASFPSASSSSSSSSTSTSTSTTASSSPSLQELEKQKQSSVHDVATKSSPCVGIETDNDIAVTTQPKGPSLTGPGKPLGTSEQQQSSTTTTPANQTPTIAQRDALTSRVYSMCRSGGYTNWLHLLELAPLASQHHLSGYNCMKFGNQGSPYAYLPLSMQQPWQADALTERQRVSESEAIEWLIQKRKRKTKVEEMDRGMKRGGGVLEEDGQRSRKVEDDEDGCDDLESSSPSKLAKVVDSNGDASGDSQMKEASPIPAGDAAIASPDDEVILGGPLCADVAISQEWEKPMAEGSNGTMEQSSSKPAEETTREEAVAQTHSSLAIKTSDSHPISISPIIPPELLIDVTRYVQLGLPKYVKSKENAGGALAPEFTTPQHCTLQLKGQRLIRCHTTRIDLCEVGQRAEQEMIEAIHGKRKPRLLSFQSRPSNDSPYLETVCKDLSSSAGHEEFNNDEVIPLAFGGQYRGFTIGNMLLSSCPGKKVRLTGPVRGRGAICRNLGLDLKRIRQLGVGALICCLDDEELSFLGAPWSEYEREADQLGMEVIRLPMAEGFSPTDVTMTDNVITSIVEQYTLRGINVLVHCRGGVGRAGLIACTWMLKLGLIRSDRDESIFQSCIVGKGDDQERKSDDDKHHDGKFNFITVNDDETSYSSQDKESQDETMQVIHRLIDTIRRRRSPKAIETAEQVAFLFKYITFLRQQEAKWQSASTPA